MILKSGITNWGIALGISVILAFGARNADAGLGLLKRNSGGDKSEEKAEKPRKKLFQKPSERAIADHAAAQAKQPAKAPVGQPSPVVKASGSKPSEVTAAAVASTNRRSAPQALPEKSSVSGKMSLKGCIDFALRTSHKRNVSVAGTHIAEAQHRQALAAYWPHLSMKASAQLRSNEPNFAFPGLSVDTEPMNFTTQPMNFTTAPSQITTPATTITIPTGNPQQPYVQIPVAPQTINVPSQNVDVPALNVSVPSQHIEIDQQKFDLMDRFTYGAGVEAKWLLADGGERRARRRQALSGIEAARQGEREAAIAIIADVKRYYEGAVLAANLVDIGEDVLLRMETALEMTESFYKGGSMKVTKLDYLSNKVMVDALRASLVTMRKNYDLACSALTHSMGLSWDSKVEPSERTLRYDRLDVGLPQLVEEGYRFSPDWNTLLAGLDAAENGVKKARAGFMPKLAFIGNVHSIENGMEGGFATDENLDAWTVGLGVELPLFQGFLTKNQVGEAKARLEKLKGQQVLLEEGLAMMVKKNFIDLKAAQDREKALSTTAATAKENRDLTDRAYRAGMAEADKIFEALLFDALARANQLRTRYAAIEARIHLDSIVGGSFASLVDSELSSGK